MSRLEMIFLIGLLCLCRSTLQASVAGGKAPTDEHKESLKEVNKDSEKSEDVNKPIEGSHDSSVKSLKVEKIDTSVTEKALVAKPSKKEDIKEKDAQIGPESVKSSNTKEKNDKPIVKNESDKSVVSENKQEDAAKENEAKDDEIKQQEAIKKENGALFHEESVPIFNKKPYGSIYGDDLDIPNSFKIGSYFLVVISSGAILFIAFKFYRMRLTRAERKYGVQGHRGTQELTPLPVAIYDHQDDDISEDEDQTLFDRHQVKVLRLK